MFHDEGLDERYPLLSRLSQPLKPAEREIVGRDHEMMQVLASLSRPELSNVVLIAEAGTGKAQSNDSLIPVADARGFAKMGDIVVGDRVFDEQGEAVQVTGVFPQGMLDVYRVHFSDGTYVDCNKDHLWAVRTFWQHHQGQPFSVMALHEIMSSSRGLKKADGTRQWFVPASQAVQRPELELSVHPYALGALIGDGSLTERPLAMSSNDRPVVERVAELIGAAGVQKQRCNYNWNFLSADQDGPKLVRRHDLQVLDPELDMVFGRRSLERRIPPSYLRASIAQRWELLRGLMDTDGSVVVAEGRVRVAFSTNNAGLVDDVQELLWSLGVRSTSTVVDRGHLEDGVHVNPEYTVHLKLPDERKAEVFWLQRHIDRIEDNRRFDRKFNRHYDDVSIDRIEDLGYQVEMTCIMVDGDSHLYLTGREHVVTHNTALVQGVSVVDVQRLYLEADPAKMISEAGDGDQMAAMLKGFFDEAEAFVRDEGTELVLFIDEFHQIIQLSDAATEAIKPVLAASGTRGIRIIAATTYDEFHKHISPNQPLVERLQRINLSPPDEETTVRILQGMAERYGVADQFYDDHLFRQIYEYTQRYMPASSQPRKSILVLDSMVGWHIFTKESPTHETREMDRSLLADVLQESLGVNVSFKVDGTRIKEQLDAAVFSQDLATTAVAERLQLSVADLHDPSRPMASLLLTGSTGVGKTEMTKQLAKLLFGDDQRHLIRFDMSEYAEDSSLQAFRSELTRRVWNLSHSVILFDEVEKASGMATRLLLQVLDDGRLSDDNNREVSFLNTYIVLTTNAGSEIYKTIAQYASDDTGSGRQLEQYQKLIRRSISETTGENRFPKELLGRIDAIVPFQPLSLATQRKIIHRKLHKTMQEIHVKHNVRVDVHPNVLTYLSEDKGDADSDAGGARAAVAKMTREVTTALAKFINENPRERRLAVQVIGEMVSENKNMLTSDAHIEVSAVR